jgi:WD40 repeat protein
VNSDASKIVAGGTKSTVFVWVQGSTNGNYQLNQTLLNPADSTNERITALAFTDDGSRLITGSSDGTVNVWTL